MFDRGGERPNAIDRQLLQRKREQRSASRLLDLEQGFSGRLGGSAAALPTDTAASSRSACIGEHQDPQSAATATDPGSILLLCKVQNAPLFPCFRGGRITGPGLFPRPAQPKRRPARMAPAPPGDAGNGEFWSLKYGFFWWRSTPSASLPWKTHGSTPRLGRFGGPPPSAAGPKPVDRLLLAGRAARSAADPPGRRSPAQHDRRNHVFPCCQQEARTFLAGRQG